MDFLTVTFPVSGVETWVFLPPLVAFVVSFFTSMGGVSGAFILLPFQMSILGYTSPSVSGTNQLFNIVAIPSGVWRYVREGRMLWPLTWAVVLGTLPGVLLGAWIRLEMLPDPASFKFFAGLVLLFIGIKLFTDSMGNNSRKGALTNRHTTTSRVSSPRFSLQQVSFEFENRHYAVSTPRIMLLCLVVGIVGGIYGIGGGAIIAPFLVTLFRLPVHTIAGATLMGTLVTSVTGVAVYHVLAPYYSTLTVAPDWPLGLLFGIGGLCGMYLGARVQKHVPERVIKLILCACVLFVAGRYIFNFLL